MLHEWRTWQTQNSYKNSIKNCFQIFCEIIPFIDIVELCCFAGTVVNLLVIVGFRVADGLFSRNRIRYVNESMVHTHR